MTSQSDKQAQITKKQAEEFISSITKKYRVGRSIKNLDLDLLKLILSLSPKYRNIFEKVDEYCFKIDNYSIATGRKVKMIFACLAKNPNVCLPISKSKLISSIWPPKKKKADDLHLAAVKSAARLIITPQIKKFRESVELPTRCALTQKKLTNWTNIHIDHIEPFSILFSQWLDINNLNPYDIALCGAQTAKTFVDEGLIKSWYDFHQTHASLQAVHKTANLKKGARVE